MAEKKGKNISGLIRMILKTGIAAAVIRWLYCRYAGNLSAVFAGFDYLLLIPVFCLSVFSTAVASLRWRCLAAPLGIDLSCGKAFSLTMQGIFFSLVIPGGAIGGDVIKMAALSGHLKNGSRTEGIFSILMDRIIGMISLFLTALILLLYSRSLFAAVKFPDFPNAPAGMFLWWLLAGVCAAGTAGGCLVFIHRKLEKLPGVKTVLTFADKKSSGKVTRILNAVDIYTGEKKKIIFWIVVTTFAIHLAPALSLALLLNAAGASVNIITVLPAVVIGNIAGLLPLFPGGIGARDAVTVALLNVAGYSPEAAAAAQIMATIILVFFNLTGAIFFIADRKRPEIAK
ncbi:MAG: flippase-like domain-containing protein [Lentisphaeria bacterium]|nr:flippase-like domain-containing protein [Lentisphaeria bacterium]